jgi:hypothetical protein
MSGSKLQTTRKTIRSQRQMRYHNPRPDLCDQRRTMLVHVGCLARI